MSIVDWFSNDLNTEERTLTRDLLSVAVADKEFCGEEKKVILETCALEGISMVELRDSIRDEKSGATVFNTLEEKKVYLLHLVRMMCADGRYSSLELHVIEVIAKRLDISALQLLSFILDEVKDNNLSKEDGMTVLDHFVKHFMAV